MSHENGKRSISGHLERTAAEAQTCKVSSLRLSHPSIAWGTGRQTPLLNRFYHARSKLVHRMVSYSIDTLALSKQHGVQLLMLGAGLDTSLEIACNECTHVTTIFAVDLPEVIEARQRVATSVNNKGVILVSADLRDVKTLWQRLQDQCFNCAIPTVVLLECVLCYIDTSHVTSLLSSLSENLHGGAMMVLYDPIVPHNHSSLDSHKTSHGYSHMLYSKFKERGAPLLHCLDSIESYQNFIQSCCHWPHVTCYNIHDALRCFFTAVEREIPCTAEPFDEFNALALLNRMYGVTLAGNDGVSFHRTWTQLVSHRPLSTVQKANEACNTIQIADVADNNLLYRLSAVERRLLAIETKLSTPHSMESSITSVNHTESSPLPTSANRRFKYTLRPVKLSEDSMTVIATDSSASASSYCLITQLNQLIRLCFHDVIETVPSVRKYMNRCLKLLGSLQSLGKEYSLEYLENPGQFWVIEAEEVGGIEKDVSTTLEKSGLSREGVVLVGCVGLKRGGSVADTTDSSECMASGDDCCEISHMCVHPSHRRQGLARALLTKLLSHINPNLHDHHHQQQQQQQKDPSAVSTSLPFRACIIHLTVLSDLQSSAWELYKSMGFVNTGTPIVLEKTRQGDKNKGGNDQGVCHMQHMSKKVQIEIL